MAAIQPINRRDRETDPRWNEPVASRDGMIASVMEKAKKTYRGYADDAVIEGRVRDAVNELSIASTKITSFIPVLALWRVRDELRREAKSMNSSTDGVY